MQKAKCKRQKWCRGHTINFQLHWADFGSGSYPEVVGLVQLRPNFVEAEENFEATQHPVASRKTQSQWQTNRREHRPPMLRTRRPSTCGGRGRRSTRWSTTACVPLGASRKLSRLTRNAREYELAEDEVRISLADFKNRFSNDDGTVRCVASSAL